LGVLVVAPLLVVVGNGPVVLIQMLQMQLQQETMMTGHATIQNRAASNSASLAWMRLRGSVAKACGRVWPAIKASRMRRPEVPQELCSRRQTEALRNRKIPRGKRNKRPESLSSTTTTLKVVG